jgi:hypothetical protein
MIRAGKPGPGVIFPVSDVVVRSFAFEPIIEQWPDTR